jgi:uncharacterized small protein (DUF1192 family)
VALLIIGVKIYNNSGGGGAFDPSASAGIADLNEKLAKVEASTLLKVDELNDRITHINTGVAKAEASTLLKIDELNDRVTHISTRVTKVEDFIKGAAGSIDSRSLNATKQALLAAKQALEAGSVAEAAYVSAYNLSNVVPSLEGRIKALEKRLNDS